MMPKKCSSIPNVEKVVAFVVARLSSSRLPAKHFRSIGPRPLLAWIVERLRLCREVDEIVIATVAEEGNLPLREWASREGLPCFWYEGEIDHVTTRLRKAAEKHAADICILVSGDCPLIHAPLIDQLVRAIKNDQKTDIVTPVPALRGRPLALQGISLARTRAWQLGDDLSDRPELKEHHFPVFHQRPDLFEQKTISLPDEFYMSFNRFSVDTQADLEFMNTAWAELSKRQRAFDLPAVLELLKEKPELCKINAHVHQRRLIENVKKVLFIVDAGGDFGCGHLLRSVELASQITERLSWPVTFMVDDGAARDLIVERGFKVFWGAFARGALSAAAEKTVMFKDIIDDFDLLVIDIFDLRGPKPGWRRDLRKKIPVAVVDNLQPWAAEADLLLVPGPMVKDISNPKISTQPLTSGLDCVILRREIRRVAELGLPKDVDLLVYLHDQNRSGQIEKMLAQTDLRGMVLDSFTQDFPELLARSRYFLSGFGASFYEALFLGAFPLCWPDSKAHLSDAGKFYEKTGLNVQIFENPADIERRLLPVLGSATDLKIKLVDGTPRLVEALSGLVKESLSA